MNPDSVSAQVPDIADGVRLERPVVKMLITFFGLLGGIAWYCKPADAKISLRDERFIGEDKELVSELSRRGRAPALEPARGAALLDLSLVQPEREQGQEAKAEQEAARRQLIAYPRTPNSGTVIIMAMKMMLQARYAIQYRLKEIEPTIQKYQKDPRFRLGYAFTQLEDWEKAITTLYYYEKYYHDNGIEIYNARVKIVVYYYMHAVRMMVDVTYTVDYILELYRGLINSTMKQGPPGLRPASG